jgi:hypothetical protein
MAEAGCGAAGAAIPELGFGKPMEIILHPIKETMQMKLFKQLGLLAICLSLLSFGALAGTAAATDIPIGTVTGAGTFTVDGSGNPTGYAFSGAFSWVPALAGPSAMNDLGQYVFAADSAGTLTAYDYDAYSATSHNMGNVYFDLNTTGNGGAHSSTLYGSILNFTFAGSPSGTVTGSVLSDGYIHYYYGFDNYPGPPAPGETSIASLGLSSIFDFDGTYNVTGPGQFNLTGTLYATPLPGTLLLLGSGLAGLAFYRRRRAAAKS